MSNIILSGLPDNVKLNKLVYLLRNLFHNEGVHKFWIKEMADIRGAELKSAKIEFYGSEQASKAATTLNGFVFRANNMRYPLTAQVDEERPRPGRREQEYDRFEHRPSFSGYSRERSRSPIGAELECSKLDLELELLRKQRMLIEEERRLLLERKKLEMVKEFGPSALKEFKSRDGARDRYYRPERPERPVRSEYRERRGGPQPWRPPPPPQYKGGKKLPLFSLPTKILIKQMNNLLLNLTKSEKEAYLLKKLVRSTIRQRLIIAMDRKPHMNCASIVELYREQYPESQDEELLKEHLKNLRACHLPDAFHIPQSKTGFKDKYSGTGPYDDDILKKKIGEHLGWVEQDIDNTKEGEANEESLDKKVEYAASLGLSEVALALHDKNDEDWMDGEQGWDDI